MKKTLLTVICLSSLTASAVALANGDIADMPPVTTTSIYTPGFYIGVQAGFGRIDEGSGYKDAADWVFSYPGATSTTKDTSQGGFAGRAFLGYSFNPYFGLETGYTYLTNNKYKATWVLSGDTDLSEDVKFKTWAWDLLAKATLPLNDSWDVYAKLGAAYVKANSSGTTDLNAGTEDIDSANFSKSAIRPAYGLGITYKFNPNWSMDLAWNGIYGKSKTSFNSSTGTISNQSNVIPTINTIMLGLTYNLANF
ncbi:MAG: outer membrane beta-barrel protein [Gammaproteobacteria bacterium]